MPPILTAKTARLRTQKALRKSGPNHGGAGRARLSGAPSGFPLFLRSHGRASSDPHPLAIDSSSGRELSGREREEHEARTGIDLGGTRVHEDAGAWELAAQLGAHAFTLGDHIYLGPSVDTSQGPDRGTALRHELAHVAQVRRGQSTGERASEDALEQEASEFSGLDAAGTVRRGADPDAPHGLFGWFDDDEEDETSRSSSDSSDSSDSSGLDSSNLGMQRSIWAHLEEAVSGVLEVGPYDAYAASFGEDGEAAGEFASRFSDRWSINAARHGVWQARLAFKHGQAQAEAVGDAHEEGSPDALDSWIDQYNNRVARGIGSRAGSLDEIPDLIQEAMDDGRLISDPSDSRIPEDLRQSAP